MAAALGCAPPADLLKHLLLLWVNELPLGFVQLLLLRGVDPSPPAAGVDQIRVLLCPTGDAACVFCLAQHTQLVSTV